MLAGHAACAAGVGCHRMLSMVPCHTEVAYHIRKGFPCELGGLPHLEGGLPLLEGGLPRLEGACCIGEDAAMFGRMSAIFGRAASFWRETYHIGKVAAPHCRRNAAALVMQQMYRHRVEWKLARNLHKAIERQREIEALVGGANRATLGANSCTSRALDPACASRPVPSTRAPAEYVWSLHARRRRRKQLRSSTMCASCSQGGEVTSSGAR